MLIVDAARKAENERSSAWRQMLAALRMMRPNERKRAIWYAALALVTGALDTFALASTMPFIALLVDLDAALASRRIAAVYDFLGNPDKTRFVLMIGGVSVALLTFSGILSGWARRRTNQFVSDCQTRLARDIMDALVHAPYFWFLTVNPQLVAHIFQRDVLLWAREVVFKMLNLLRDIALVVMPLALVFIVTPLVGILALGGIAIVVAAVISYSRPRIALLTNMKHDADAKAFGLSGQALSGIKDVVISGRQDEFVSSFNRAYRSFAWAQTALQNQHQLPVSAILILGQLALLIVAMVLWSVGSDRGTLAAQMSVLVLVTSRIVPAANRLSSTATTFFSALPAVRGIDSMLTGIREAGKVGRSAGGEEPLVRPWRHATFQAVDFSYVAAGRPALSAVSVVLEAGRSYGIVGPSGAGKSTFADLLMGFVTPTAGSIEIDGKPLAALSLRSWRSRIGYVPQSPFIADTTLAANIAFGVPAAKIDQGRLQRAVTLARLDRLVSELPQGLATNLGDRGIRLSGGQRQRVAIARAVYDDCDLLVLDEATSALDSVVERDIAEAVHALAGSITLVIIAHRISTIVECDEILVFEGGRLASRGPHLKLMAESMPYRALVAGQAIIPGAESVPVAGAAE